MANGSLDSRQSEKRQLSIAISAVIEGRTVGLDAADGRTNRQSNRSAAPIVAATASMIPVGH